MRTRKPCPSIIVLFLVLSLIHSSASLSVFTPQNYSLDSPSAQDKEHLISEDPLIDISDDDDFGILGLPGDGSSGNPYRIEDFNITGAGADLIQIRHTRKHFIIENCTLHQSGGMYSAIMLWNVTNAQIVDNTIHDVWYGVQANNCTNVAISDNNLTSTQYGLALYEIDDLEVLSNEIECIGFCINQYYGDDVTVSHNILNGSSDNLWMKYIDNGWFENNTSTHSVLGMYMQGTNLVIKDNILANDTWGMNVAVCVDTLVFNNTLAECGRGLIIEGGNELTFANNTLLDSTTGFEVDRPDDSLFENNTLSGNDYGVIVVADSERNWFVGNIFDGNTVNAEDNGTDTFFGTNYWSDYAGSDGNGDGIGDTPHPIAGTATNEDLHPLMTPSTPRYPTAWAPTPTDQHLEFGDAFRYDLNCTAPEPIYWWLSGAFAPWFTVDSNGVVTNTSVFTQETDLPLTVWARNIYSFTISATFRIEVNDTLIPTWDEEPTDQFHEYGHYFSYDLNASDAWDIDRYWTNGSIYFGWNDITGLIYSDNPPIGVYGFEVRAYDPEDKYVSATFKVTVADTIPPTVNHPADQEIVAGSMSGGTITWIVNDLSPMSYDVLAEGNPAQGGVVPVGNTIDFNYAYGAGALQAPGTYNYTIVVTDGYHTTTDTVLVVVLPATTTPTTPTTTPTPLPPEVLLIVVAGVAGIVVIIIIVVVLRKGRK
jgi:nitrous oxidase accessory protein NosD